MKRRTPWWAVLLVVVIGASVGGYAGTYLVKVREGMDATNTKISEMFSPPFGGKRYARILMIGVDNTGSKKIEDDSGLSDTLVVFAVDTQTKEIRAISIPRDTRVEIPGHKTGKINSAHALGGPKLAVETVSKLLNCPIEYYVKTTVSGLVKLVDMVGGVYIVVDKNMHYTDRRGKLFINLKGSTEKQLLNGTQAMGFVRFRHDAVGDYGYKIVKGEKVPVGRVVRQQYFFRSLANRILAMPHKSQRLEFLTKALDRKYIASDLNMNDWKGMMDAAKDFDPEKIVMDCLPSVPNKIRGISYVIPDTEAIPALVARNLQFEGPNPNDPIATNTTTAPAAAPITIQVLNGSKKAGLAKSVGEQLTKAGYNVISVGNSSSSKRKACTLICKNDSNPQIAALAQLLGGASIDTTSSTPGKADVTVVLGRDFDLAILASLPG